MAGFQQIFSIFRRDISLWRVLIAGLVIIMFFMALTAFQQPTQRGPTLLLGGMSVERSTLSTEGFLSNSKFVVTKASTSYTVNTKPSCWIRHCDESNNKLAFSSCDTDPNSIGRATEWNALGVRTMERYVQTTTEKLEGLSDQMLVDAMNFFSNASEVAQHQCWSALFNWALVASKLRLHSLANEKYAAAEALAKTNELKAIVHAHWGLNEELAGSSSRFSHYEKVRSLDVQVESDYWGVAMTQNSRKQLSNYGPSQCPIALTDYLLYKHFASVSISRYSLLPPGSQDFFIENRYIVLHHILPPFVLRAAQKCYRDMIDSGSLQFGDGQAKRYVTYNDRCARFIHYQLTDFIRTVIAHNSIPSYTYFGGYKGGSTLDPHTDRHACEFTLSLTVQQHPFDKPWTLAAGKNPLFEKDPKYNGRNPERVPDEKDTINADLLSGDGLLFMGRHLVHFRKGALPEGHWTNQIFFHYVQDDFTGELA